MQNFNQSENRFGGLRTKEKLEILEAYLDAYTTALKKMNFNLWYIDGFAGTGEIVLQDSPSDLNEEETTRFLEGSATIACRIEDKPFDRLFFIENDEMKANQLKQRMQEDDRTQVLVADANEELRDLCNNTDWHCTRAVVFLDPFSWQVKWETIEAIANTKAIDIWIMFPVCVVSRFMRTHGLPEETYAEKLDVIFGDDIWRSLYHDSGQKGLFESPSDDPPQERDKGIDGIVNLYKEKLKSVFAGLAPTSKPLKNSNNASLFELIFAVSNENGKKLAIRIADHILKKI